MQLNEVETPAITEALGDKKPYLLAVRVVVLAKDEETAERQLLDHLCSTDEVPIASACLDDFGGPEICEWPMSADFVPGFNWRRVIEV